MLDTQRCRQLALPQGVGRGQNRHRSMAGGRGAAQGLQDVGPVSFGQVQVQYDQVGSGSGRRLNQRDGLGAVPANQEMRFHPGVPKGLPEQKHIA